MIAVYYWYGTNVNRVFKGVILERGRLLSIVDNGDPSVGRVLALLVIAHSYLITYTLKGLLPTALRLSPTQPPLEAGFIVDDR